MTEEERVKARYAADVALQKAIEDVVHLARSDDGDGDFTPSDEIVVDFVVVAHCTSFELADRGASRYAYMTAADDAPSHVSQGLLVRGLEWWK